MEDFKGTRGKWLYAPHMRDYKVRTDDGTKYHRMITICDVSFNPQRPNEAEANAQLIATAPELLQALKEAIPYIEDAIKLHVSNGCHSEFISEDKQFLAETKRVINKALGKEESHE